MRSFDFQIIDPPISFANRDPDSIVPGVPVASMFALGGPPTEICRLYGYLMLLGQNLEFELRECLASVKLALGLRGISPQFTGNPERATFEKLIDMFARQLDTSHGPTCELVEELHRARMLRNRLAHGFLSPVAGNYYMTHGGQQVVIHRLQIAEKLLFPLISLVGYVGRSYAADYGLTKDCIDRHHKAWETEQRKIDEDFKQIFGDEDSV